MFPLLGLRKMTREVRATSVSCVTITYNVEWINRLLRRRAIDSHIKVARLSEFPMHSSPDVVYLIGRAEKTILSLTKYLIVVNCEIAWSIVRRRFFWTIDIVPAAQCWDLTLDSADAVEIIPFRLYRVPRKSKVVRAAKYKGGTIGVGRQHNGSRGDGQIGYRK